MVNYNAMAGSLRRRRRHGHGKGPRRFTPGPGYFPSPGTGYPPPGHGPDYRWSEAQAFREHCERLRSAEHEIRDRLAYTPYGEEREQLQYRLSQIHQEREPCRRGRP